MKEINATCTKKQNLLRRQQRRLNEKCDLATSISSQFYSQLADLHPDKVLLFLRSRERQKCIENLGSKNMEIKVAK